MGEPAEPVPPRRGVWGEVFITVSATSGLTSGVVLRRLTSGVVSVWRRPGGSSGRCTPGCGSGGSVDLTWRR